MAVPDPLGFTRGGVVKNDVPYYLAGPMSNIPQFNFPAFSRAVKILRERGFDVVSPAELDDDETKVTALMSEDGKRDPEMHGGTWGDFLARDVKVVADQVGGIFLLPGWQKSRGALLEAFVATLCGHNFAEVYFVGDTISLTWCSAIYINEEIFNVIK